MDTEEEGERWRKRGEEEENGGKRKDGTRRKEIWRKE